MMGGGGGGGGVIPLNFANIEMLDICIQYKLIIFSLLKYMLPVTV